MRLSRYIRAFFKALELTLKGEALQPADKRHPQLHEWIQQGQRQIQNVFLVADKNGFNSDQRKQTTVTIDHRPMSMDVILRAVQHNLELEYPMLMDAHIEGDILTIYAINMNDQYRVSRLVDLEEINNTALAPAIKHLHQHLMNVPPSNPEAAAQAAAQINP